MATGRCIICFDYELGWGSVDRPPSRRREAALRLTRAHLVPEILRVLEQEEIPATWAVVGHLLLRECGGKHPELAPYHPAHFPEWFARDPGGVDDGTSIWMARDTIERIAASPVPQELASHSFSHVDFADPALTAQRARDELEATRRLLATCGRQMVTHVFPRGRPGHLEVLKECGLRVYRTLRRSPPGLKPQFARFAEEALAQPPPLVLPELDAHGLLRVQGGMLFHRRGRFRRIIPVSRRVARALKGLAAAAETGGVFLLWAHPVDFATDPHGMLAGFRAICAQAAKLRAGGRLEVITLGQLAGE